MTKLIDAICGEISIVDNTSSYLELMQGRSILTDDKTDPLPNVCIDAMYTATPTLCLKGMRDSKFSKSGQTTKECIGRGIFKYYKYGRQSNRVNKK